MSFEWVIKIVNRVLCPIFKDSSHSYDDKFLYNHHTLSYNGYYVYKILWNFNCEKEILCYEILKWKFTFSLILNAEYVVNYETQFLIISAIDKICIYGVSYYSWVTTCVNNSAMLMCKICGWVHETLLAKII